MRSLIIVLALSSLAACTNPTPSPTITVLPTLAPSLTVPPTPHKMIGSLTFRTDCNGAPNGTPRYWNDSAPAPSPNSKLIATIRNVQDNPRIVIEHADKTGAAITIPAPNKSFPLAGLVWSPNNEWLAFSNIIVSGGGGTIFLVKPDGTGLRKLIQYEGFYDTVAWSPDQQEIAFTSGVIRSARPGGGSSSSYVDSYKIFLLKLSDNALPELFSDGCAPVWLP